MSDNCCYRKQLITKTTKRNIYSFSFIIFFIHFSLLLSLSLVKIQLISSLKQPDWLRAFEWPSRTSYHEPTSDKLQDYYNLLHNSAQDYQAEDLYSPRSLTTSLKNYQNYVINDRYDKRLSRIKDQQDSSSRWDYYQPMDSEHHDKEHEVEQHHVHGKEVGLAYPILLALLLLGALFIPFLSLFFFLAVSAFNCHGIGPLGAAAGSSGGSFQPVAPFFGKRRKKRASATTSHQIKLLENQSELIRDYVEKQRSNFSQDEDASKDHLVTLNWWQDEDQLEAEWAILLRSLSNWLEINLSDQNNGQFFMEDFLTSTSSL